MFYLLNEADLRGSPAMKRNLFKQQGSLATALALVLAPVVFASDFFFVIYPHAFKAAYIPKNHA